MNPQIFIPFASSAIIGALTYDIYRRYQEHHGEHVHLLFWGVGLAMTALASLCGGLLYLGWSEYAFMGWFLFGAILNAAWIGQGTILLLFRKRWVTVLSMVLVLASVVSLIIFLSTPLDGTKYQAGVSVFEQYKSILPADALIRRILVIFNIYGTLAIVGGALWSSYLFYRKRVLPNRVIGNVLIAAGALVIALAGSLTVSGYPAFHELSQLVFAVFVYIGFVVASRPAGVPQVENNSQTTPATAK